MNQDIQLSLAKTARIASIGLLLIGIGVVIWSISNILSGFLLFRHSLRGSFGTTQYTVSTIDAPDRDFLIDSDGNFSIRIDTNNPVWKEIMQREYQSTLFFDK